MTRERDNIAAMDGYVSGEQPDNIPGLIKLNTNENPYPPAPEINNVIKAFDTEKLRRYPPANANEFRDLAAELHAVNRGNIIATRGGDELLRLMITTFVNPGEIIGVTDPTYSLYSVLARIQNCPVLQVPLAADWTPPVEFAKNMNDAGVKLTFLGNPHAPSGVLLDQEVISRIANDLDGLLLLDEAYIDFVDPARQYRSPSLLDDFDNVVILRTLSKGYSLAGLRLGYGIGREQLIRPMIEKTRDSYNLDWLSQEIASTALRHRTHAAHTWKLIRDERVRITGIFRSMGLGVSDSEANFLLVTFPDGNAENCYEFLRNHGIFVRYFHHKALEDKLRISIGTPHENDRLLECIRDFPG